MCGPDKFSSTAKWGQSTVDSLPGVPAMAADAKHSDRSLSPLCTDSEIA